MWDLKAALKIFLMFIPYTCLGYDWPIVLYRL